MNKRKLNQSQFTKSLKLLLFLTTTIVFNSVGQDIYWSEFQQTTIVNDELVRTSGGEGFGTAKSQNTIHNEANWSAEYTVSFDDGEKIWGIIAPETPISLANMTLAAHFSNGEENLITLFYNGETVEQLEVESNSLLRFSKTGNDLIVKLGEETVFNVSFSNSNSYKFTASLNENTTFERMNFSTDFQETFVAEFDTLTNRGKINVNLPANAPSGPYHYLIGTENYVDLNLLYQSMLDSSDFQVDDDFLEATNNNDKHIFEDLEAGVYYVSVVNENLQVIEQEKLLVIPENKPLSNSSFNKEGDLFVAGGNNAYADINAFISKENTSGEYGVEVFDPENTQYFGFGIDTITMSGVQDILYGVYINDFYAFPILDGEIDYNGGVSIEENTKIFIKCSEYTFTFYKGGGEPFATHRIQSTILELINDNESEINLNLKIGLSKSGLYLKPILHQFYSLFYAVSHKLFHLNCGDETGGMSFSPKHTSLFTLNYYSLMLEDENDQQVGSVNQLLFNSLPPGTYTLTGVVSLISYTGVQMNFPVNMTLELGYKTEWLTLDNNYIEDPNSYSVLVDGYDESNFLQGRANNYLEYDEEGWISYTPVTHSQVGLELLRFMTSNLSATPGQLGIFNEDFILHAKFLNYLVMQPFSEDLGYQNTIFLSQNSRVTLRLTTTPSTGAPYGQVKVYVNNLLKSTFPRSNSAVSVIPNSIKNGHGFKDVITSFGCPTSEDIYGHLKYELDGFYHTMKEGKINFVFDQEYEGENLKFNIYNSLDLVIKNQTDFPAIPTEYGKNYITIDVSTTEYCIGKGYFYLEVINSKGEKKYLRFYNDYFVQGCDLVNLEYEENNSTE